MLIKTSPPSRQIERMFQKRDWRWRHAYHRPTDADLATLAATDISAVAAIELGLAKKPRRSARIGNTADRAPMPARNIRFQGVAKHREDSTAAPC
ncbi:MAG: hypothetical protein ACRETO_06080 [Gammaproteobacteria bacterium]